MYDYHITVTTTTPNAQSTQAFIVPRTPGLFLMSEPGATGGMTWSQPPISKETTKEVIRETTVRAPENRGSGSYVTPMTLRFGGIPVPAKLCVTDGKMATLHVSDIVGEIDSQTLSVAGISALPFSQSTAVISVNDGRSKVAGLAEVKAAGNSASLTLWPSLTKNEGQWIPGSVIRVDGFCVSWLI